MLPTQQTKMVSDGIARLTDAFRDKAVVSGMAKAFLASSQDLENATWQVVNAILNPTGDILDRLAAIVGETRDGRSDADFLAAYKLRIRVNLSRGLAEDLIQVSRLVVPTATYSEYPVAAWLVEAFNFASPRILRVNLAAAKDGGTRGVLHFTTWPTSQNLIVRSVHGGVTITNVINSVWNTGGGAVALSVGKFCSSEQVQ